MSYFLIFCYLLITVPVFAATDNSEQSFDRVLPQSSILPTIVSTINQGQDSTSNTRRMRGAEDCPTTPTPDGSETGTDGTTSTGSESSGTETSGTEEPTGSTTTTIKPLTEEEIQDTLNNLPQGATRLTLNKEMGEILRTAMDMDFFKIQVRNNGNLTIALSAAEPVANSSLEWRAELFFQKNLDSALQFVTLPEAGPSVSFQQGVSSGAYYLKVYSPMGESRPTGKYLIKASLEENPFYEASINDSIVEATPISLGGHYSGNLSSAEDVDYYLFEVKNEDTIDLSLKHNQLNSSAQGGWSLRIFSDNNFDVPIQHLDLPVNSKFVTAQIPLSPKNYYIQLTSLNTEVKPEGVYQFSLTPSHIDETTSVCLQMLTYAKNPDTNRWAIFPTPCDVPNTWFTTQVQPVELSEQCEVKASSSNSRYFIDSGILSIPTVEAIDATGCVIGVYQAQMQSDDLSTGKFDLFRVFSKTDKSK